MKERIDIEILLEAVKENDSYFAEYYGCEDVFE